MVDLHRDMGPAEAARVIWRTLGRRTALHAATLIKQRGKREDVDKRYRAERELKAEQAKIAKIRALIARGGTAGERDAAELALHRILGPKGSRKWKRQAWLDDLAGYRPAAREVS